MAIVWHLWFTEWFINVLISSSQQFIKQEPFFAFQYENHLQGYCALNRITQLVCQDSDSVFRLQDQFSVFLLFHRVHLSWLCFKTTLRYSVGELHKCLCEVYICEIGSVVFLYIGHSGVAWLKTKWAASLHQLTGDLMYISSIRKWRQLAIRFSRLFSSSKILWFQI